MVLNRKKIFSGNVVTLSLDRVRLPNGSVAELEIVRHPGGAAAVAIDDQQRLCLIRQYRYVVDDWLWELPAGKLEQGEPPFVTVQRELLEEAGVSALHWEPLGKMFCSPGLFDEVVYLFLARDLQHQTTQHEEHEHIEVHWLPFSDVMARVRAGEILDAKTLIGISRAADTLRQN